MKAKSANRVVTNITIVVITLAGVVIARVLANKQDWTNEVLVGLLILVVALQLGALLRQDQADDELIAKTPDLAMLERALEDELLRSEFRGIVEASDNLWSRLSKHANLEPIYRQRREELLEATGRSMRDLGNGRFGVDDPDRQYAFALTLAQLASVSIHTISFRDREFWSLPIGKEYENSNKELALAKGKHAVERIFVGTEAELNDMRTTIAEHDKHFAVYVLDPTRMTPADQLDFVIYDGTSVRYAEPVALTGSRKSAILEMDSSVVKQWANRFTDIRLKSMTATEFLATGDGSTTALGNRTKALSQGSSEEDGPVTVAEGADSGPSLDDIVGGDHPL